MASTIKLKNSTTPGNAPSSLAQGEVAINVADGGLFYGTTGGNSVSSSLLLTNITASGNISSSGNVISSKVVVDNGIEHKGDNNTKIEFTTNGVIDLNTNGIVRARINDDGININSGRLNVNSHITSSGNISASGGFFENLDVDGTTNLDAVDIDGDVQLDGTFTVGVNGNGKDVRFYGQLSNRYIQWDQSVNQLKFQDNTRLAFGTGAAEAGFDSSIIYDASNLIIDSDTGIQLVSDDSKIEITGNVTASGNISASSYVFAERVYSEGYIALSTSTATGHLFDDSNINNIKIGRSGAHITASGNISASGNIIADRYFLEGTRILSNSGTEIQINETTLPININGPNINLAAPVTASIISASGAIIGLTGSFTTLEGDTSQATGLLVEGTITASGNISSSSDITANSFIADKNANDGYYLKGSGKPILSQNGAGGAILLGTFHTSLDHSGINLHTTGSANVGLFLDGLGNVTASGDISSSGKIYSTNTSQFQASFQPPNSATADVWYGPNSQGPNYYFWNKNYTSYPDIGVSHGNSGWYLPVKAYITNFELKFQNVANTTNYAVTGALQVLSSDDFSYPITVGSTINSNVVNYTGQAAYTTGVQHALTNLSVDVNATYPAGSILYPRYNVNLGSTNWRGNFTVNYYEVK